MTQPKEDGCVPGPVETGHAPSLPGDRSCVTWNPGEPYPPCDPRLPAAEPALWSSHAPDAHLVARAGGGVAARCSLWWTQVPPLPGERLGVLGHFATVDAGATRDLLAAACAELAQRGCTRVVGPMDGNTWRRYRFVTERATEPPFLLEPDNPDDWPRQFEAAGFAPLAQYFSTLATDLARCEERVQRAAERLGAAGVTWRPLAMHAYEAELLRIHDVSVESFRGNYLYTPLPAAAFIGQYLQVRAYVDPELVLLAEHAGRPVGYVFGVADVLAARRGQAVDTVIVKTVAVRAGRIYGGLGNVLVQELHRRAHASGFRRAIHALMHEANNSRNLSGHYAQTMRRYTLYSRPP
jgi:L-amino acid N-acyltransferase YncA